MIATVTLNPSLDKTLFIEELIHDDANRCARFRYDAGGKGLNVSRVLRELGEPSLVFGFLGGPIGQRVEKYLHDEGLEVDFNWTNGETRENVIIASEGGGHPVRINLPGPPIREDELNRLKRKILGRANDYDVLVLSGSLPPGLDAGIYHELAEEARLRGKRVVLDADGDALRQGLAGRPFMIKPNSYELERLVGRSLPTDEAIHQALDELIGEGRVELVVLTRGARPAIAATRTERWLATPPEVHGGSAVGAGDSFIAGFLHRHQSGADLPEALRWGLAAGAACACSSGTELAHLVDIVNFLPRVQVMPWQPENRRKSA